MAEDQENSLSTTPAGIGDFVEWGVTRLIVYVASGMFVWCLLYLDNMVWHTGWTSQSQLAVVVVAVIYQPIFWLMQFLFLNS